MRERYKRPTDSDTVITELMIPAYANFGGKIHGGLLAPLVNYTGGSSMVVGIKVTAENVKEQVVKHTNNSYFTMVAKGDDGEPAQVPGLRLTNMTEVRRYAEAILRQELKETHRESMKKMRDAFEIGETMDRLRDKNCVVELDEAD